MEKLTSLAKRRGFVFQSSEIYGGLGSTWDYGPLGVLMKNNIKAAWWRSMVQERDDIVGLDAAILMHPKVWEASGHLAGFADALVECKSCHHRFRADQGDNATACPACGLGDLTEPRMFNLMFKTFVGPVEEDAARVYLRPETAQGIFVNFENVQTTTRKKLPFGIAQMGKSFRNEITTGNFIFRCREFEQMEMEYFVMPGTDDQWFEHWVQARLEWWTGLGIRPESLTKRQHGKDELSHYSKATTDIEFKFAWGWGELEGIANRTDFDLRQHAQYSGKSLEYYDEESGQSVVPYVIEPASGVDRGFLAFLTDAYEEEPDKDEIRTVLHLHPAIAPIKVAVLPLSRKAPLQELAREVYAGLRKHWFVQYDASQSIGRRYRRQDEIGTPLCVTIDFESLDDRQVTIRDRDTMAQERVPIA
ncbi:MAG: glycine--tRNA ligase, partial [Dehalococcoidia bacterium]